MSTLVVVQDMLIEEFNLTRDQVEPETLLESLGIDSLATIEFMFLLEDKFKISLPEEHKVVRTVGDISRELDDLIEKSASGTQAS